MPKQRINRPAAGADSDSTDAVWVAWDRARPPADGHVQLTVTCPYSYARDLVSAQWNQDILVSTPALSRQDLNRLIAALRRARDQAYGRDE